METKDKNSNDDYPTANKMSDDDLALTIIKHHHKTLEETMRDHTLKVLNLFGWHLANASVALGISRGTLNRIIKTHNLKRFDIHCGDGAGFDG